MSTSYKKLFVRNMNRLCIYVTYNREHKIKEYMGYMLKAIRECVNGLYVVCNYPEILGGYDYVRPYADAFFFRENRGYDAGAYKDMLCTILGWKAIYEYDEVILMNDSFLGPFWDLSGYFALMEGKECDFWGLTRQFGDELKSIGYKYSRPFVHSYFLVFRKKILRSVMFKEFWERFDYPETFTEAVLNYEMKINEYLEQNGFRSLTFTDVKGMLFNENENVYYLYLFELIKEGFPILKKKSLLIRNSGFANVLKAITLIEDKNLYPVSWIWELIDGQFYIENYAPENANCLEQFCNKFSKIYIYGAGVCGKNLVLYFEKKGWKQSGILVSNKAGQDIECTVFEEADIDDETGIIVSVIHQDASEEIVKYIESKSKCKREQLFVIYDCKAIRIPQ